MKLLSSLTLVFTLATSASALSLTDIDVDGNEGEPEYRYMATWSHGTWEKTFDLLQAGYDPSTMRIVSAIVSFAFADDSDDRSDSKSWKLEKVKISVDGTTLWNNLEVDGTHFNTPYSYDWYSKSLDSSALLNLQDGIVDYSVKAKLGDFYLKEASLTAQVERLKVPDTGATFGLLGLGIASLFVLRRQMLKGRDA